MGRRTTGPGWRAVCRGAVAAAVLGLWAPSAVAADAEPSYGFAPDARTVPGVAGTAQAVPLTAGRVYRSSLPVSEAVHYRLDLDATSNAYVSATAVPPPDAAVSASDGVRVSVRDGEDHTCSSETETFGGGQSTRPLTAVAERLLNRARQRCATAGTYYAVVERVGTTAPDDAAWDLELAVYSEPALTRPEPTAAPEARSTESATPLTGEEVRRDGGTGFASAVGIGQGVWRTDLTPGQTVFYKVPLGWGERLQATADLAASGAGSRVVVGALELSLHSPVRAVLDGENLNFDGRARSASLDPTPPVAYENRYSSSDEVKGARFGGSYYLAVHLSARMTERFGAGPFAVTLRVRVEGAEQAGPAYGGQFAPRDVFAPVAGVGGASGLPSGGGDADDDDRTMTIVAVSGIGGGTAILAVLGVWTVAVRRRAVP